MSPNHIGWLALSPRFSPTYQRPCQDPQCAVPEALGDFHKTFFIPFPRQLRQSPQSPTVQMAQERTGIVVGTNKGHVCSPPISSTPSLSRVSVLFGLFFRDEPSRVSRSIQPTPIHRKLEESYRDIYTESTEEAERQRRRIVENHVVEDLDDYLELEISKPDRISNLRTENNRAPTGDDTAAEYEWNCLTDLAI